MNRLLSFYETVNKRLRNARHPRLLFVGVYTALFLLCSLIVFFYFLAYDKSFVWCGGSGNIDGISQHYTALSYWGTYLRQIFVTLFTEGKLVIPMYDTSIGLGSDIINTLSYYVIGDPLTLLSALVPRAYTEYLYTFLIVFRLWLAGLAFSALCLEIKKDNRFFTLLASMAYIFCGYTLFAAVRHPYFSNPLIYFPLVILGAEYIFKGKKPWLFILSVTLAAVSNFYFFYMIALLTVVYVLVRMFDFAPKGQRKKIMGYLTRFALWAGLGVMMAAILFYPAVRTTLASARQTVGQELPLFYRAYYYKSFIYATNNAGGVGDWDFHGLIPLTLLAVFLLWLSPKGENKTFKRLFVCGAVFLLIPACGWLLNGTAYVSNRWVWGYALLVGLITATQLPRLLTLSRKGWGILLGATALYALGWLFHNFGSSYSRTGMVGFLLTVVVLAGIMLLSPLQYKELYYRGALMLLLVVQLWGFGFTRFELGGYAEDFVDRGESYNNALQAQSAPLTDLGDTSFYRYEDFFDGNTSKQRNAALVNDGNSTNGYFSLASDSWYDLVRSVGHTDLMIQLQHDVGQRTIIGTLANVKYYTQSDHQGTYMNPPYGYNRTPLFERWIKSSDMYRPTATHETDEMTLYKYYENECALPLGYTYDSYITRAEYDKLSFTDRQSALLYNAVLEEDSTILKKGSVPEKSTDLSHTESFSKKKLVKKGNTYITEGKAKITLTLSGGQANKETYLSLKNLYIEQKDPVTHMKEQGKWEDCPPAEQRRLKKEARDFEATNSYDITVSCGGLTRKISYYTPENTYYTDVHDFSVNLGYLDEAPTEIVITLPVRAEYSFDELTVTQLDFDGYKEQTEKLAAEHLEKVEFTDNRLAGEITVSENKLLCVSLSYAPGWRAFVDGKEVEILKTDLAFMGLELSEGTHQIEFRFFTPYLLFGAGVSAIGWTGFAVLLIIDAIKRKKKEGVK